MADLRLDLDALSDVGVRLHALQHEFASQDGVARDVADATGHGGLAGTVRDFATAWDRRRGAICDEIGVVGDAATAISQTFRELDQSMATLLHEQADRAQATAQAALAGTEG